MLGWRKGGNFPEKRIASTLTHKMTTRPPAIRRRMRSTTISARIRQ